MTTYKESLEKARARRRAPDNLVKSSSVFDSTTAVLSMESFTEALSADAAQIKGGDACSYARLCMQPVSDKLTKYSLEQGERVKAQLQKGLAARGCPFEFRYQGSIPMDVHIRATHDVDLLVIGTRYMAVDWSVPGAKERYTAKNDISLPDWLLSLRKKSIDILTPAYPTAKVDISGAKSIALSGGSLARKIDVVPSCWHDGATYQSSSAEKDRGISIVDTKDKSTPTNYPFVVRHAVDTKDAITNGGAKRVVRLLKSLKEDAGHPIALSSFDIVSLVCHMPSSEITNTPRNPFAIVDGAVSALTNMAESGVLYALKTADGTRLIFDQQSKKDGFTVLLRALGLLCDAIAAEITTTVFGLANRKRLLREHIEY